MSQCHFCSRDFDPSEVPYGAALKAEALVEVAQGFPILRGHRWALHLPSGFTLNLFLCNDCAKFVDLDRDTRPLLNAATRAFYENAKPNRYLMRDKLGAMIVPERREP